MKCTKCGSIIPDDSLFCPDCGELIKNIGKIRQSAKDLVLSNKYGYEKVVGEGLIPQFSEYLSIEGYEKILSLSDKIIKLQKEFDYEQSEERKKEKRHQDNWDLIIIGLLLKNPAISVVITCILILVMLAPIQAFAPIQAIISVYYSGFSLFGLSPLVSLWLLIYGILCVIDIIYVIVHN